MIFYFCVSSRNHEQLHDLVSVETHCIVQSCVPFLGVEKHIRYENDRDGTQMAEPLPTLSLELILTPQDSRYSTMSAWPVLVATCRGVLHNCNVCDGTLGYKHCIFAQGT